MLLAASSGEQEGIHLRFPTGTGPGTMAKIPSKFEGSSIPGLVERLSPYDFKLTDASGRVLGAGDVVRVKGKLYASKLGGPLYCSITPTEVVGL